MDPTVAGAFIDDSQSQIYSNTRILGVRLRKFSNWHRLLLNVVQSPFLQKGTVTLYDLRVAVGICKLPPLVSRVRKPWLVPALIYVSAVALAFLPKRFWTKAAKASEETTIQRSLRKRIDAFLRYAGDYLQDPIYTIVPPELADGKKLPPKTPRGRFHDAIEMVGELIFWGINEERAWGMPLGQARVYRIMARKAAGNDVDVEDEEEKKFREEMKAFLEKQKQQPPPNGSRT